MKVIYISQGNIPSKWAHTVQTMRMAEAFAKRASHFELLTQAHLFAFLRPRFDYETWYGIQTPFQIRRLPTLRRWHDKKAHFPHFDRAAVRHVTKARPDLVYTRAVDAGVQCVRNGINTIIETHAGPGNAKLDVLSRVADDHRLLGVVTIVPELLDAYVAYGLSRDKLLVWPDAVDAGALHHARDKRELRRRLGLPDTAPIVTYSGHLYEDRGVEAIVGAALQLPHVLFLVVGGWPDDIARCRRAADAASAHNIRFAGFVPNGKVSEYLQASDILLMLYTTRAFPAQWGSPMKLFEYMAARRPIIATNVPSTARHLHDEVSAILVPPEDTSALIAGITQIMSHPRWASQMADAAYAYVQPYTWDNRARDILERFTTYRCADPPPTITPRQKSADVILRHQLAPAQTPPRS